MRVIGIVLSVLLGLSALPLCGCDRPRRAGGEHDHAAAGDDHGHDHDHTGDDGLEPVSVTILTDKTQLFMEYPRLVQQAHAEFLAHLTVLENGQPVRSGSLTFELTTPDGQVRKLTWTTPRRDGLFVPEWDFDQPGTHQLRLILDSPQAQDTIDVGDVVVHPSAHAAEHAAELDAEDEPPNLVPFLLEQQWAIGLRHEPAARRTLIHRLQIPGRIVAPQGALAAVAAPVAGRLLPPQDGALPQLGDVVRAGEVIARIEPSLTAPEAVQFATNRMWMESLRLELAQRALDLDTKAAEVRRTLAKASARLTYARRAADRAADLRAKGLTSEQQLDEARQDLALAEAEHEAALALKDAYEEARRSLEAIDARWGGAPSKTADVTDTIALPIRAPISGEIVSVAHIEGEHLEADHQEVFRIVNLAHVWITANISEFDLAMLSGRPGATMKLAAYPDRRFDIRASGGRLVHIGRLVDPDTRTVSVTYELANPEGLFRVGMFADVFVETETAMEAVAVPEAAVVKERGQPIAFVLHDGEHFIKRTLITGVRDNGYVEIKDGIAPGERVVTHGAYALKLAATSPSSFGHGHVH